MPESILKLLQQDTPQLHIWSIDFDFGGPIWLPGHKDWSHSEGLSESLKSQLLPSAPFPRSVLLSEVVERVCDLGKVLDEPMIEVGKANEAANLM